MTYVRVRLEERRREKGTAAMDAMLGILTSYIYIATSACDATTGSARGLKKGGGGDGRRWEEEIRVARLGRVELPAAQRSFGVSG